MADIFRRPALAAEMAGQLLRPGPLNEGLRSGLFLPGLRRTGKTTFVLQDLAPALEQAGAVVIYADLWSDPQADPAVLVHGAIRRTLDALRSPGSALLQRLRALKSLDLAAGALKFGFEVESLGAPGGVTLAAALTQVVDQARTDVVLIVDEVQHALSSEQGGQLLYALKAARDAINPRPGTPGHFLFIGTGSHRAQVGELTARRNQAFAGATSIAYPVLGEDYVAPLPSQAVAHAAFGALGHRPEEMLKALRHLHLHVPKHADPDTHLPAIAAAMRTHAADIELAKVEQLGGLAQAVFDRIAGTRGDTPGVFTGEALADYGRVVGREVRTEEVQSTLNALLDANVVMRRGHGQYVVTDPFVQQTWTERRALP